MATDDGGANDKDVSQSFAPRYGSGPSATEAAKILDRSRRTIRRWIKTGALVEVEPLVRRPGDRKVYVSKASVEQLLRKRHRGSMDDLGARIDHVEKELVESKKASNFLQDSIAGLFTTAGQVVVEVSDQAAVDKGGFLDEADGRVIGRDGNLVYCGYQCLGTETFVWLTLVKGAGKRAKSKNFMLNARYIVSIGHPGHKGARTFDVPAAADTAGVTAKKRKRKRR